MKTRVGQLVFIQWMLLIKPLTNDERGGRFERWIITDRQNDKISNDQQSDRRRAAYLEGLSIIDGLLDKPAWLPEEVGAQFDFRHTQYKYKTSWLKI